MGALSKMNREKHTGSDRRSRKRRGWLTYLALVGICACFVAPYLWMFATSFKTAQNAMTYPPQFLPHPVITQNYGTLMRSDETDFLLWTRNTLTIALLAVSGTVISSAVVAYGFSRIEFRGRGTLFVIMLATMMIPFPVVMVPLFRIFVGSAITAVSSGWGRSSRCGYRRGSDQPSASFFCGSFT